MEPNNGEFKPSHLCDAVNRHEPSTPSKTSPNFSFFQGIFTNSKFLFTYKIQYYVFVSNSEKFKVFNQFFQEYYKKLKWMLVEFMN